MTCGYCSRQNNGPPKVSTSYSSEPVNMVLCMTKGTLQMQLRLRILRWGYYNELFTWAQYNLMSSKKWKRKAEQ